MKLKPGDRVYYISGSYALRRSNPLKGSEYECQGTAHLVGLRIVRVRWDNGTENGYLHSDLELAVNLDQNNPNLKWVGRRK